MFDLKGIEVTLTQLEEERGIQRGVIIEAIEYALAAAYKKDYGKKGQIIRASIDMNTGTSEFSQIKIVVEPSMLKPELEEGEEEEETPSHKEGEEAEDELIRFNEEHHIMIEDALMIKKDIKSGEEMIFPLEAKADYGRVAAQTAKQVIIQRIREAEKVTILEEYGKKQGEILNGTVQRIDRGNVFIDLGKAVAIMPYDEQIRGEYFKQGERVRAYLYLVEESTRGINVKLSRSHPKFLEKLFEIEVPEIASGVVEIKAVSREPGSRSKIAVESKDELIDPVGSCVGQRGVRVTTIMSELGGEKIDIIEWSEDIIQFIEDALSPAKAQNVELNEEDHSATIEVAEDQLSLAIGKGGQNVRLAAKLTGWKIDIKGLDKPEEETTEDEESTSVPEELEDASNSETTPKEAEVPEDDAVAEDEEADNLPEVTEEAIEEVAEKQEDEESSEEATNEEEKKEV